MPWMLVPSMAEMKSPVLMPARDGRRVVDGRDDLDEAVFLRDFEAQTAELAAGLHLHVGEFLRIHIARMRIERAAPCR